jgi:transposase
MRKEPVMSTLRFIGLDVHADTITVAIAEQTGEVRCLGTIPNRAASIRKLVQKLGPRERLRACYEAGPTGYVVYWQLTTLGVDCQVVAPSLVPVRPGDRVKTDRRDAEKLARGHRAGDLTPVWVPDPAHEALRDVVRAREAAKKDQLRARHRLGKFLLRQGRRPPVAMTPWSQRHLTWVQTVHFDQPAQEATRLDYLHEIEHVAARLVRLEQAIDVAVESAPPRLRHVIEALQALRGIAAVSAVTIVAEVGQLSRFARAPQFMGYGGLGCREYSTGSRQQRGAITKAGNAHLRRIIVEAAWAYRHRPAIGLRLRNRQSGVSEAVKAIAWKAQHRLHARYHRLSAPRQMLPEGHDGDWPRTHGVYLGDWRDGGARSVAVDLGGRVDDRDSASVRSKTRKGESSTRSVWRLCADPRR